MLAPISLLLALLQPSPSSPSTPAPFAELAVYNGAWTVRAEHPWGGGPAGSADHLVSRCQTLTAYVTCEQTVNGKPQSLIVYTLADAPGHLHTRTINPEGLAGGRGDLIMNANHWTYLDKPPASLKGNWSRTENFIVDHNTIRFEESESSDEGRTWTRTNAGTETRDAS